MTLKLIRNLFAASVLLTFVASCGPGASDGNSNNSKEDGKTGGSTTPVETGLSEKIKIKTPDDKPVVEFKPEGERLRIEFSSGGETKRLDGESKESGKRKYDLEGSGQIAEVKSGEKNFKVRTIDGRLLWKVKFSEDKIKISDDEEGTSPYVLDIKPDDRVKILRDEEEIGKINFYRDRGKVKVKTASEVEVYESNTTRYSAMYGVMLMDKIPEAERYIIMAEILIRGR